MPTIDLPDTGRRSGTAPVTLSGPQVTEFGVPPTGRRSSTGSIRVRRQRPPMVAAEPNEPAITAELWNETDSALIGTVARSAERRWSDSLSNLGSGSLSVPVGSNAERVAANQLAPGRHLRFRYRDREAYSVRIERTEATRLHADHGDLRLTAHGVDKRVVLDRHLVQPNWATAPGVDADTRTFDWTARELPTHSWKTAVQVQPTISLAWQIPNTDPPFFQPWEPPRGWTTLYTPIIQPRTGVVMPAGSWGARRSIAVFNAGWYLIQFVSIGRSELFLNSTKVAESAEGAQSWLTPVEVLVPLPVGQLDVAVRVTKESLPVNVGLPGTFANFNRRSLLSVVGHFLPNGPNTPVTEGNRVLTTGTTWKVLDYPSRFPAPTVGRILRALTDEADGLPANFERGFSDTHDSAGKLWPLNDGMVFRDSDTIWNVLEQMRAHGYESRMSTNGYRLDVWGPESFPGSTPIKVQSAENLEQPTLPNRLRVRWARGRFTVSRTATERVEAPLNLGEVRSEQQARAIAEAELDRFALRADRWVATPTNYAGDGMYDTWRTRDWVKIQGEGENVDLKVESITVTEDDNLFPSARLELVSPLEWLDERLQRDIDRMGPGALGASASPVRWLDPAAKVGFVQEERISEFSQGAIIKFPDEGGESTPETFDVPTRISLIRITAISNPGSPGIFVRLLKNGQNINPILWLSPGSRHAVYLPNYLVFLPGETLQARMIDAPNGAGLVSVSFHAAVAAPGATRPEKPFGWL